MHSSLLLARLLAVTAALAAALVPAQPAAQVTSAEMPMDDYLGLLAQVSPAAHAGARAYLQAHHRRCGRSVTTAELRAAMAVGNGEPTLMAMIRASHVQDAPALARLEARIACTRTVP